ncbi:MAG: hypothetical protein AB7J35_17450 [Dehalococcoidia bacterium]
MTTQVVSPLGMLFRNGLQAIGARPAEPCDSTEAANGPSEMMERMAGGFLAAMGFKEIADDLDLHAITLLSAASIAGLQVISLVEPGVHRLDSALFALEDLLRRTAPAGA